MNFRMAQPAALVDLNNIKELEYIQPAADGGLLIGTMTRDSKVEHSPLVIERSALICEAMPHIAHPQIRNRGTFGGAMAHADPAGQLPAWPSPWKCGCTSVAKRTIIGPMPMISS